MKTLVLVTVLTMVSSTAGAQVCDRALALRVNDTGLDFVAEEVRPLIPDELEVPPVDRVVYDWSFSEDDVRIQLPDGMLVQLAVKELKLYMDGGALHVAVTADVDGETSLSVLNPYLSFGEANCDAALHLRDLQLDIGARLQTPGERIQVEVERVSIDFDDEATEIALKECFLGELVTMVLDFLRSYFGDAVRGWLENKAEDAIPQLIEGKLNETIQYSAKTDAADITVRLDELNTDRRGVELVLGGELDLRLDEQLAPCVEAAKQRTPIAAPRCTGSAPELDPEADAMFGAAVTGSVIDGVIASLWQRGQLCIDSERLGKQVPLLGDRLAELGPALGLGPETQISFKLRLGAPPRLLLDRKDGARLELNDLRFDLEIEAAEGSSDRVTVVASASVGAVPLLDPVSGSIALDLRHLAVQKLELLGQGDTGLVVDSARLQRFIDVVALPVLQRKLSALQLSPSVLGVKDYLVDLRQLRVGQGFIAAYLDAYHWRESDDVDPPTAELVRGPDELVGPGVVSIYLTGEDDETPVNLVRYRHRVDGGEWSEAAFGRRVDVVAGSGMHRVEIEALDLQGNRSVKPIEVSFEVDADSPEVELLSRPDPLIEQGNASVRFAARDSRTASEDLEFQLELFRVDDEGVAQVVQTTDFASGIEEGSFEGLQSGVYRIRVTARDEAGNVGSIDVGFIAQLQQGCQIVTPRPDLLPLLLLGLLLLSRRSRRR